MRENDERRVSLSVEEGVLSMSLVSMRLLRFRSMFVRSFVRSFVHSLFLCNGSHTSVDRVHGETALDMIEDECINAM